MSNNYKYKCNKYKHKINYLIGGSNNYKLEDVLEDMFKHQIQIKMLHFQTKKYGFHKALDSYLEKFLSNFDKFLEVAQTDKRVNTKSMNLKIEMLTDNNIIKELKKFSKKVLLDDSSMIQQMYPDNPGLLAIRDEFIADLDQLIYLLSFE